MLMTKALRETQTSRAGCSKAEQKNFAPPQTPSRGRGTAKSQSAGVGHYLHLQSTDPVWWRSIHAISSYRGNRTTNKAHKQTDRTDNNTLRR